MTGRVAASRQEGFTLIETLIGMLIMSIAVITIVSALAGLAISGQQHRGHAIAETTARSFGQAVQAKALASTRLVNALPVGTGATVIGVVDAAPLAGLTYVAVDQETLRITGVSGNSLTVLRAQNDATTAAAHGAGTAVVPVLRCASAAELQPAAASWLAVPGMTASVGSVEWWDPTADAFSADPDACAARYDATCVYADGPTLKADVRQECGSGLFRVTVDVTTDSRHRSVTTSTSVLVRRGGAT